MEGRRGRGEDTSPSRSDLRVVAGQDREEEEGEDGEVGQLPSDRGPRLPFPAEQYKRRKREVARPFRVDVVSGSGLAAADWTTGRGGSADPYVILTVVDERGRQIWRYDGDPIYDTTDPRFDQTYLIPGCPGTALLVVTVMDRDDLRDQFLGQCILPLSMEAAGSRKGVASRAEVWERGGRFRLALDVLRHLPRTTSASDVALDAGAVDLTSIRPRGEIVLCLRPMERSRTACGYLRGGPDDGRARAPAPAGQSSAGGGAGPESGPGPSAAPPKRKRRYWCVIAEHTLYFFKTFGSSAKPMHVLDLKGYALSSTRGGKRNHVKLTSVNGRRSIVLLCSGGREAQRWRGAFRGSFAHADARARGLARRMSCHRNLMAVDDRERRMSITNQKRQIRERQNVMRAERINREGVGSR